MKKSILLAAVAATTLTAAAQVDYQTPGFFDNYSIGLDGGVTTPLKGGSFIKDMRGLTGLHIQKQVTPALALGVEGQFGINTSSWKNRIHSSTAFDNSYVGAYGAVNLMNLFGGYPGYVRPFNIEAVLGMGWGHDYQSGKVSDHNYVASKAGLNFNFNVSDNVTLSVKPQVIWDMSDSRVGQSTAAFDAHRATFNLLAGVTYNFGPGFIPVRPYNQGEIDDLNNQINTLRAAVDAATAAQAATAADAAILAQQLADCQNQPTQVVTRDIVTNNLESVRYVFYKIGSATIGADQQPNVEMIANYMKHNPESKVVIKGYASKDGNLDFNIKLAQRRAESVKNELVKRYKINPDRITAEGQGIGEMFKEESWNRVSICILEDLQ